MTIPAKYLQPAPGESGFWQRLQNILITNTFDFATQAPALATLTVNEERLAQVCGKVIPGDAVTDQRLTASLANPETEFTSADGSTRTFAQYAADTEGLYFYLASIRDNPPVAAVVEPESEVAQ